MWFFFPSLGNGSITFRLFRYPPNPCPGSVLYQMSVHLLQRHATKSLRAELDAALSPVHPAARMGRTITFAELPEWMKDNEFILTGYRG